MSSNLDYMKTPTPNPSESTTAANLTAPEEIGWG